jgi:hypothetical protein
VIQTHITPRGSTNINNRGESLCNYIMANGLDIINRGNRPTFVTTNRQEVFLISNFRRVLNIVCVLLGISPASDSDLPTFRNPLSVPSSKAGCRVLSGW